ncbi:MAG TPA: DUF2934 domain-containing protein [Burkholderiaceae bacterium]|nr:DUF2934 domain-containing protein [Burkholderiaceae bacterium]
MSKPHAALALPRHPVALEAPPALAEAAVSDVLEQQESEPNGLARMDPELRHQMVATAAYYIAEQRGFVPGHELADWMAAEAAVDASLQTAAGRA